MSPDGRNEIGRMIEALQQELNEVQSDQHRALIEARIERLWKLILG